MAEAPLNDDDFSALALAYLEGAAGEAETRTLSAELSGSVERRRLFVSLAKQNGLLGELYASAPAELALNRSGSSSKVIPVRPVRRGSAPAQSTWGKAVRWSAVGIAASIAIAIVWLNSLQVPPNSTAGPLLRIVAAKSGFIIDGAGDRTPAKAGATFPYAKGFATSGSESSAELEFPDGTRMWLGADTEISSFLNVRSSGNSAGKHLALAAGSISADVAKQPAGAPMIVSTPGMDARIVGTKFNLRAAPAATRLDVIEGRVTLTRRSDQASVDVAAGEYTIADEQKPLVLNRRVAAELCQPRIDCVQTADRVPQQAVDAIEVAFPYELRQGNLAIVVVGWNDTAATVKSVTDNLGNTYTLAIGPSRGKILSQCIYYAKNITGGAATVTVTFNQSAVFADIRILEYSGLDCVAPFDAASAGNGTGMQADSGRLTATSAGLIFGAGITEKEFVAAGMGFTQRIVTKPDGDNAEDMITTTGGEYSASAPLNTDGEWLLEAAAFKAAGAQDWRTIGQ